MKVTIDIAGPFPPDDQRRLEGKISEVVQDMLDAEYGEAQLEVDDVEVEL